MNRVGQLMQTPLKYQERHSSAKKIFERFFYSGYMQFYRILNENCKIFDTVITKKYRVLWKFLSTPMSLFQTPYRIV